jgi:hypothetical protein
MLPRTLATLRRATSARAGLTFHGLAALRAASTLAVASLLLAIASAPAEAHSTHGYTLDFFRLYAVSESGEVGSDEPYVLMAVVNLATRDIVVRRTSIFGDVDTGESRSESVRLWGPSGTAVPFPGNNPDNVIVLVMAMEHDDCNVDGVVMSMVDFRLRSRLSELEAATRDEIVSGLQDAMAIAGDTPCVLAWYWQTEDDRVGLPKELRITAADMAAAHGGATVEKVLQHDGGDTYYRTYFRLQAAPSVLVGTTSGTLAP